MPTLRLEIVTPEAKTFSDDVDLVTMPGLDGEMGILAGHMPLLTQIRPGELRVTKGKEEFSIAVGDGFVEITGEKISVLTDLAIRAEEIDESKAEEARHRAEEALRGKLSADQEAATRAMLEKSLAQLNVKRRRRERHG